MNTPIIIGGRPRGRILADNETILKGDQVLPAGLPETENNWQRADGFENSTPAEQQARPGNTACKWRRPLTVNPVDPANDPICDQETWDILSEEQRQFLREAYADGFTFDTQDAPDSPGKMVFAYGAPDTGDAFSMEVETSKDTDTHYAYWPRNQYSDLQKI